MKSALVLAALLAGVALLALGLVPGRPVDHGGAIIDLRPRAGVTATAASSVVIVPTRLATHEGIRVNPASTSAGLLGTVAFLYDGDIWLQGVPGGTPERLTTGDTFSLPVAGKEGSGPLSWSPSGEWLLVGDVIVKTDGTFVRTGTGCIAWSPVTDELACVADNVLRRESADGKATKLLKQGVGTGLVDLVWSPDGQRLAFSILDRTAVPDPSSVWVVDRDGYDLDRVLGSSSAGVERVFPAFWTTDGRQLAFYAGIFSASILADGIGLQGLDLSSEAVRPVLPGVHAKPDLYGGLDSSGRLVYTDGTGRFMTMNKRIAALDLASGIVTPLTVGVTAVSPAVSPDGRTIAYVSGPEQPGWNADALSARRIWLMDAGGDNKRPLTADGVYREERPQWTEDGSALVFVRIDDRGFASLWSMRPGDSSPEMLLTFVDPTVSPAEIEAMRYGYYGYTGWTRYFAWWQPR